MISLTKANFLFNNISSTDYLVVDKLPSIVRAAKDITKIEVVGRDGFLTLDNNSYKSTIKNAECWIRNLDDLDFISSWLTGSGTAVFSNEPDKIYKVTILNQIEFSKVVRTFYKFIIIFECQPYKESMDNAVITLTEATQIYNSTGNTSKPIIKIYGTGLITLTINDNAINLNNINGYVTINSDLLDCYKGTQLYNRYMVGDFPLLQPGSNSISWAGNVTSVEITPNWRWL